jgi:hypothetical protein
MQLFPLTVKFPAAFTLVCHNDDILGDYEAGILIEQSAHNSRDGKWPKHTTESERLAEQLAERRGSKPEPCRNAELA